MAVEPAIEDPECQPLLISATRHRLDTQSFPSPNASRSPTDAGAHERHRNGDEDVQPEVAVAGRNLGWSSAYILITSRVIGSGIFATPGVIAASVGSVGLSLLLWVAGALISWCGLAVALEYGCLLPRSGGEKVYLEYTYRRPRFLPSAMIAVHAVLLGFTASNCIVFGEYVQFALGNSEPDPWRVRVTAIALMTAITLLHGCSRETGIFIQNVLGWVKIGLAIFMVFASLCAVLRGRHDISAAPISLPTPLSWSGLWSGSVWNWGVISTALFKVLYSYAGLENVNNVLSEFKNPVRTLSSAATAALATACLLYLLVNLAYFLFVPLDEIKSSGKLVAALFFERVFGPAVGRTFLPFAVAVSAAGSVMVVTFAMARLNQELARQGFLPYGDLLSSSKPFASPLGGLIVHYIPSVLVISLPVQHAYSFILEVQGYPGQFFALALALGLLWLRVRSPELHGPYRAFLLAVWFRVVLSVALLVTPLISQEGETGKEHLRRVMYAVVGLSVLVSGVLYWMVWTILIPKWNGYRLEEASHMLEDGTTITKLVRLPRDG